MPSSYSTNLKIELQATGENSGTWGTITNTNLGTALEQAIIGYGNPNYLSDANLTLTYTDTNSAQTARALVLNVTSALSLTGTRELVVPTIQKQYIVQNNTTGGQSITVKTSAGTGITVPNGRKAHLYVNGTDVIYMDDFVDINGGTIDGTTIGGSSAAAGTFTTLTTSSTVTLNGGTANGVLFLNGSKVATSGGNFTFDGTSATIGGSGSGIARLSVRGTGTTSATGSIEGNNSAGNTRFLVQDDGATRFFGSSNAETMRITASGDLGIGTSSPITKLDVRGDAAVVATSGYSSLHFNALPASATARAATIRKNYDSPFDFNIYASTGTSGNSAATIFYRDITNESMRLDSSGNLGIGTANPGTFGKFASVAASGATSVYTGTGVQGLFISTNESTRVVRYDSSGSLSGLHAWGNGPTELMRLDTSGNLGIGTSSPAARLDVTGTFNGTQAVFGNTAGRGLLIGTALNGGVNEGSSVLNARGAGNGQFLFQTDGTTRMILSDAGNLSLAEGNAPTQALNIYRSGSTQTVMAAGNSNTGLNGTYFGVDTAGNGIINQTQALATIFSTSGTERARITSGGDLLVGTTSSGGTASNITRVTGGIFSTFNATPSIANNTATTVATLSSGEGMYLVSASLLNSGDAASYNELALVRVSQSNTAVSTIVGASSLDITVSGLNVQVTHGQGSTQTIPVSIIRLL